MRSFCATVSIRVNKIWVVIQELLVSTCVELGHKKTHFAGPQSGLIAFVRDCSRNPLKRINQLRILLKELGTAHRSPGH